jgi:hypothetical protein
MKPAAAALVFLTFVACASSSSDPNLVVSYHSPELTVRIDPAFKALPPLKFPIGDVTSAERRVFIDAKQNDTVQRMVIVQFEKVKEESDFRFVFPSTPPRRFGAQTYRAGTFVYDDSAMAEAEPDREAARTRQHIGENGFLPAKVYKVSRLARVADPEGLSEVIIFYMENAEREFPDALPTELPAEERERLFRALEAAVTVVHG